MVVCLASDARQTNIDDVVHWQHGMFRWTDSRQVSARTRRGEKLGQTR